MKLEKLVLGVALATGLAGCTIVPKAVCSYSEGYSVCTRKFDNAQVEYAVLNRNDSNLCRIMVVIKDNTYWEQYEDYGCDGSLDTLTRPETKDGEQVVMDIVRHSDNGVEVEEFFKELDALRNNDGTTMKTFNMMKDKLKAESTNKNGGKQK